MKFEFDWPSGFFLLFLFRKIGHGIGKKGGYFRLGMEMKWAENPLNCGLMVNLLPLHLISPSI